MLQRKNGNQYERMTTMSFTNEINYNLLIISYENNLKYSLFFMVTADGCMYVCTFCNTMIRVNEITEKLLFKC